MKCLTSSFALLPHVVLLVAVGVLSLWSAIGVRVLLPPSVWCLGMRGGCSENFSGEISAVCPSLTAAEAALGCCKVFSTGRCQGQRQWMS